MINKCHYCGRKIQNEFYNKYKFCPLCYENCSTTSKGTRWYKTMWNMIRYWFIRWINY